MLEQLVVLDVIDRSEIDRAVELFWQLAAGGGRVRFQDGDRVRDERVHVAGYAGHNRLMDGKSLPAAPSKGAEPLPSFVMACASEPYFSAALRGAGSTPVVMTRSLMAPEGYVLDAIAQALGENQPPSGVRSRVISAYGKWQRLGPRAASTIFARPDPRR